MYIYHLRIYTYIFQSVWQLPIWLSTVSSSLFNLFSYTYFARVMTLHKFHIIRKFISKFKQLQAYKTCPTGLPRFQFVPSAYKWKIIAVAVANGKWSYSSWSWSCINNSCFAVQAHLLPFLFPFSSLSSPPVYLSVPFFLSLSCVAVRNRHVVFASTGCLV